MKHSYLVLLVFISFSTSRVYAFPTPEFNTGVQSTKLENTQNSQATITESSEPEPTASAVTDTADTVTDQPSSPIENMFHQVVDWLYPKQKEKN